MMRVFLLILPFFLLSSCALVSHKNFEKPVSRILTPTDLISPFEEGFEKAMFKTRMTYKRTYLSGLMLIKRIQKGHHRVTLLNEMGLKLMDLEFLPDSFKVHYVLEALDRNLLISTLERDLRLLLMADLTLSESKVFQDRCESREMYQVKQAEGKIYYFKDDPVVTRIETSSLLPVKVTLSLSAFKSGFPWEIIINHRPAKLEIKMERIK